jgi:hypothetical protein
MRIINKYITAIIFLLSISCEKDDNDFIIETQEGFFLEINDSIVYNSNHISFYDFSSHLIYLKGNNTFSFSNQGTFAVSVDSTEIYSGQMYPMYSSNLPVGPVIRCAPTFYSDYIIPIEFNQFIDSTGNSNEDPRNDSRIIDALKKQNQYRDGLSCEILSVEKISLNRVKINLNLTNNDFSSILYLDPDKMGIGLFHYFTNGLLLKDTLNETFTHQVSVTQPESLKTWSKDWLSSINAHDSKTLSIIYDNFEKIKSGQFEAKFNFPGLGYQVLQKDLIQDNGRIWLGDLSITKIIEIE